jgi:hypothetical protein
MDGEMNAHRTRQGTERRRLTVLPASDADRSAIHTSSDELWEAWQRLAHFEDHAAGLGSALAPELIVLWAVWRFGNSEPGDTLLGELVGDDLTPRFRDPLVEDMMLVAFALGAGWGAAIEREPLLGGEEPRGLALIDTAE